MAKNLKWQDEYWLLLMQIYLQKPAGIKPMYSKKMVDLSMELHIAPNVLFNKMCQIANLETPRIEYLWELYGNNPKKLKRAVNMLREMWGFNNALAFYEGVETQESFEKDFKPISADSVLTPVMLTLILDLYFLTDTYHYGRGDTRGAGDSQDDEDKATGGGRGAGGFSALRPIPKSQR